MITSAFGFWSSPISPQDVASKQSGRSDLRCDKGRLYWIERRADQAGRSQICSLPQTTRDVRSNGIESTMQQHLPEGLSAQSGVHEYGGAPYCVVDGVIYLVNAADQQIYRVENGCADVITQLPNYRFADLQWDSQYKRLLAVAEIHADNADALPENQLVAIDVAAGTITVLHQGHDFYSFPRLSSAAKQLAFIAWDMPNMPWDKTVLYVGDNVAVPCAQHFSKRIDADKQAPQQPLWGHDDALYVINDPDGFGQLFCLRGADMAIPEQPIFSIPGEIGLPMWVFGQQSYQVLRDGTVIFSAINQGQTRLGRWIPGNDAIAWLAEEIVDTHYLTLGQHGEHEHVFFTSAFRDADDGLAVVEADMDTYMDTDTPAVQSVIVTEAVDYKVSTAELITVPVGGDATTYAYYYAPANADAQAPAGSLPPLIVIGHGGPTGMTSSSFNPQIQFWTSRGFAVADVNYRGSTGFGRAYRESLYGEWGVADVADAAAVAEYVVAQGKADRKKLIIRGKSAGGYLVLAALAFTDTFTLGAVYYGISDLSLLAEDTHKFERDYPEYLIAPYPAGKAVYEARSPIHHLDKLNAPVIVLQGLEDKVVPPNQSEAIVTALEQKGIPVEYVAFPVEKHGFRKPENIQKSFERELAFYQQHIGDAG